MTVMNNPLFDVIIVGAGAAGCVLAGRLSEVPGRRVLLIEAGPDVLPGREHPDIRNPYPVSLGNPHFSWPDLCAELGVGAAGKPRRSRHYLQGFGVGGGSNIQGMVALRGHPGDYDGWLGDGATGWGWADVLPYFRKLERDLDFSGPMHGSQGPMPVRRTPPSDWARFSQAIAYALQRKGYPLVDDCNADFRDGISALPIGNLPDQRVSASMAYLTETVRARPNLSILPDALVENVEIRNGRAQGVVVRVAGGRQHLSARETIVACGGLHTPAVLMRSGVGPGARLQEMGIRIVRDSPGVGRNLQNHCKMDLAVHLPRASRQPRTQQSWGQNCLRYSSGWEDCPEYDMLIVSVSKASWHPLGERVGALVVAVHKPFSKGVVNLSGPDPALSPKVSFNMLSDERDFHRLVEGTRFMLDVLADPEVVAARHEVFLPDVNLVHRLNRHNARNWLQAAAIAGALEPRLLRRLLLKELQIDMTALARSQGALDVLIRERAQVSHHVCGTCRMGTRNDAEAVVGPDGLVWGIEALRIVDASIFPTIPRANTHFPVLMAAEKIADLIKAEWKNKRYPLNRLPGNP